VFGTKPIASVWFLTFHQFLLLSITCKTPISIHSGVPVTPIGQGWTNNKGLLVLGGSLTILQFALMIKFDFTSHFIIVVCLMVILVITLIIINFFCKFKMGYYEALYVLSKGLQSICYATEHSISISCAAAGDTTHP